MRQCPVCDTATDAFLCPVCGFDANRDYESLPTFAPTMSITARRKAWQEMNESQTQEQQWKIEREQLRKELQAAQFARNFAKMRAEKLEKELAQLKAKSPDTQLDPAKNKPADKTKIGYLLKILKWFFTPIISFFNYLVDHLEYLETCESSSRLRNIWNFVRYAFTFVLLQIIVFGPITILILYIFALFS